jgi:hypothetical protein
MSTPKLTHPNALTQHNTVFDSPLALERWSSLDVEG